MDIKEIKLTDIKAYKNNPRLTGEAVDKVAASIKEFGFMQPIVIDKNNVIVAGHVRAQAATKLKMKTVPCLVAENLTPEQIAAYRLADNKTAEFALWDYEKLEQELDAIGGFNMADFGFINLDDFTPYEEDEPQEAEADGDTDTVIDEGDIMGEPIDTGEPVRNIKECTCPKCGFKFEV